MEIITCSSAVSTNDKGVFGIGSINLKTTEIIFFILIQERVGHGIAEKS
jgi:hypothetical protein